MQKWGFNYQKSGLNYLRWGLKNETMRISFSPLKTPDIGWWILKMVRPHPWCKKSVLNGGELLTFSMICDFQTAFCPTNLFLEIHFPTLLLWTHFSVGIWKKIALFFW
jgi:hypothetical protein